jgi:hypothetical protein
MFSRFGSKKLIVLVTIAIVGASLWIYLEWSKHVLLERKRVAFSKLQAAGVPMTSAERQAFASVPADVRDSTEEWSSLIADRLAISNRVFRDMGEEKLFAIPFVGLERDGKSIPPPKTEWDQEQNAAEYLQQFEDVIQHTRELVRSDGAWRYISTKDLGDDEIHPLNQGYSNLGELLLLSSHVEARRGQCEKAYEDLMAVLRIVDAGQFEAEWYSVHLLARLHSLASISAARLSVVCNWTDQQLADLQTALANADFKARMKRAYMGEVSGNLKILYTKPGSTEDLYFAENLSLYAEIMLPIIQGFDNPWPAVFPTQWYDLEELEKEPNSGKKYAPLFVILPATSVMIREVSTATAIQRSAIIALARQRQLLKSGTSPESLEQLVTDSLPENFDVSDPFIGGPLKSSMTSQGWVVYAVGMNNVDDGGDIHPQEDSMYRLDSGLIHGWP